MLTAAMESKAQAAVSHARKWVKDHPFFFNAFLESGAFGAFKSECLKSDIWGDDVWLL